MNAVNNPGFETATAWEYLSGAYRAAGAKHSGSYGGACVWRPGYIGYPDNMPRITDANLVLVNGHTYRVRAYVATFGASHGDLECQINTGSGAYVQQGYREDNDGTFELWNLGSFVAVGTAGGIRFVCTNTTETLQGWLIDDILVMDVEDDVAVKLAERSVDAVVAILQSDLATELTAIDTDRADGVTLAAPAAADYYKHPKAEIAGGTCRVEVFEGGFDFFNPYTDAASARAVYEIPITVRLTFFNRNGETAEVMAKRMRRYEAGVFNVFNKNITLGGTDDALKLVVVERVVPHWDTEGEDSDKVAKVQLTFDINVKCEEVQS